MSMNQKGFANIILVVVVVVALGAVGYFVFVKKSAPVVQVAPSTTTQNPTPTPPSATNSISSQTKITILIPSDVPAYDRAMTAYIQEGGQDPSKTWSFVKKTLSVPYTNDIIRASAEAASKQLTPYGGPAKASVAYMKIQNGTAYVLLDIDLDGWAGVSASLGRLHPVVEKTLLQFPQIEHVVFGYAPGDNQ